MPASVKQIYELQASLVYILNSGPTRATQWDPVSKTTKQNTKIKTNNNETKINQKNILSDSSIFFPQCCCPHLLNILSFAVLEMKLTALHRLGKHSTTEVHILPHKSISPWENWGLLEVQRPALSHTAVQYRNWYLPTSLTGLWCYHTFYMEPCWCLVLSVEMPEYTNIFCWVRDAGRQVENGRTGQGLSTCSRARTQMKRIRQQ